MTKREMTIKALLTTTDKYSVIAAEIGTTEKSIAFYAHKLRKASPKCLDHRSKTKSVPLNDLIAKYTK